MATVQQRRARQPSAPPLRQIEFTKTVQQLSTTKQSAMEVVSSTLKARGPFGLYKGLDSMVYFATPKAAIRFSGFEAASNAMRKPDGSPMFGAMTAFAAGLVAGALEAMFVTTPQVHHQRTPVFPPSARLPTRPASRHRALPSRATGDDQDQAHRRPVQDDRGRAALPGSLAGRSSLGPGRAGLAGKEAPRSS